MPRVYLKNRSKRSTGGGRDKGLCTVLPQPLLPRGGYIREVRADNEHSLPSLRTVNMPVFKRSMRARRTKRSFTRNVLVHQQLGTIGAGGTISVTGADLDILNRGARVKWAKLTCTSIDPHFVQMSIYDSLGELSQTTPTMMTHKNITNLFLRNRPGTDFGNISANSANVVFIYSNATSGTFVSYSLKVCIEYSMPTANNVIKSE